MKINKTLLVLLSFLILTLTEKKALACSMYKITIDGKTMVGCNEDAWRTTSVIWFENANQHQKYGAGFTGSRQTFDNKTAPQSGMNIAGLTFSRLVAYHPKQEIDLSAKKKITNEVTYLTDILHQCATVAEVKHYIEQYDHSIFIDDVYMYIDSTGKYLIVEPYKLIEGDDPNYVLSNFCPSITKNEAARKMERYRNGEDFLKNHSTTASLDFCRDLSDTMHVCRSRNGDGTLLTSIWNTKDGLVNLYFYHSYDSTVQFNLAEELTKGDHILSIPTLFAPNPEFERLTNYKTPFNTPKLRVSLAGLGGILGVFALLLGFSAVRTRNSDFSLKPALAFTVMNLILTGYLFVLATNVYIFYFDAPYRHYSSGLITASSYTPFLLLLVIAPLAFFTMRAFKSTETTIWLKALTVSNSLIYLLLIIGFAYWGLYSVWN